MALEKFVYKVDGKKIELPKADQIPFKVIRKMHKVDEDEQIFVLLETLADQDALDIIDELPAPQVVNLINEWAKSGDKNLGES